MSDVDHTAEASLEREARLGFAWLRGANGRLMRRRAGPDDPAAWVAIVRTPAAADEQGQLILGFGASAGAAIDTAHTAWLDACRELGPLH